MARRRNPGLTLAGIPVMEAAIGGLGALVVINAAKNLPFINTQLAKIENAALRAAIPPALAAAAGWALHKYGPKTAYTKGIAKFIVAASLFKLVDDVTDNYFKTEFPKMFGEEGEKKAAAAKIVADAKAAKDKADAAAAKGKGKDGKGTYGAYIPTYGNTSGAYLPVSGNTGGAYVPVSGVHNHGTFGLL